MSTPHRDRDLLLALFGLQLELVDLESLLAALADWTNGPARPLGQVLCDRGALGAQDCHLLEQLVCRHLEAHDTDARRSLGALVLPPTVHRTLLQQAPALLQASLGALPVPPSLSDPTNSLLEPRASPRYQPLRLHARGGLGIVSLARDTELGREVALKEIQDPYADIDDLRSRFILEAELTGRLEHPGIVPVYGLGCHANGRPFYAMRFIQGTSLQEAIDRFHGPTPPSVDPGARELTLRRLLGRFVAVCNTLAFAHSRGVVHRDVKPANVMLGDYGETIVVDWGLARSREQRGEPSTRFSAPTPLATSPGQMFGTPAFMPPEQAAGQLDRIGVPSDVFALGATLYCLLAGRPPHDGLSLEPILQASFLPPRQVRRDVPVALESVCLKAMARLPEDRYPSAQGLAEEVERWLADEPVAAHPEPLVEKARRWGRRHRTVVSVAAALLLAAVVGLTLGLWAVRQEQAATEVQRDRARDAAAQARASARLAEANLAQARTAVDQVFLAATRDPRFQREDRLAERNLLLEKALPFYQNFRAQKPDDPALARDQAESLYRVGYIQHQFGRRAEARKALEQARDEFQVLRRGGPGESTYALGLAQSLLTLGVVLKEQGAPEALKTYEEAIALLTRLNAADPGKDSFEEPLARALTNRANLLARQGKLAQALQSYLQVRDLRTHRLLLQPGQAEQRQELAILHGNLVPLLAALGRMDEAVMSARHARESMSDLVREVSGRSDFRRTLAVMCRNEAAILANLGRNEEALRAIRQACDLDARLEVVYHDRPGFLQAQAGSLGAMGLLLGRMGRSQEALQALEQARDRQAALVARFPNSAMDRQELALTQGNLAQVLMNTSRFEKAREALDEQVRLLARLHADSPDVPGYQNDLARAHLERGKMWHRWGRPQPCQEDLEKALALGESLVRKGTSDAETLEVLLPAARMQARMFDEQGQHLRAAAVWARAAEWAGPAERPDLQVRGLLSEVRGGNRARALAGAKVLRSVHGLTGSVLYRLACVHALVAHQMPADRGLPLPVREKEVERLAQAAVRDLIAARDAGYFTTERQRQNLSRNRDLERLRGRSDFEAFRASLAKPR